MIWLSRISSFLLVFLTLLPLLSTGRWFVRVWDFPRLQIATLLLLPLAFWLVWLYKNGFSPEPFAWLCLTLSSILWQGSHIIQFSPIWMTEIATAAPSDQPVIKFMVANLDYENDNFQEVSKKIANERADVLLLIELNDTWKEKLTSLRKEYQYHHEEVRGEGLGIAIWSNLKIKSAQTKHLVSQRRASIWATLETTDRNEIHFVGVHPTPPGLLDKTGENRRDSRVRDAELILVAKEIASQNDKAWVVAGDFNDVAWSHTTRLFKRTSGLKDPRIGRSFMGTFSAEYPLLRFPIDHVFLSNRFLLKNLARTRIPGSDHFAVLASIAISKESTSSDPGLASGDKQDIQEIVKEGKTDAKKRDVDVPH